MKRFDDLINKAEITGCRETVCDLAQQAEALLQQDKIHVAIIGGRNSGKTTIINGIVGQEIRVPDMLSKKEKPLRLAFEEMEDDPNFDCVTIDHEGWCRERVVFYEIKADEIMEDDDTVSPLINRMDCVFYTVSALVPMTGEDVRVIEALRHLALKVILTKVDMLEGDAVEKVVDFVFDFCRNHALEQPINLSGKDKAECVRTIRYNIPTPEDMTELREKHLDMIADQARRHVLKAAGAALEENQKQWKNALLASQVEGIKNKRILADWNSLRADMLAKGLALSNEIAEKLESQKTGFVDALHQSGKKSYFNRVWQRNGVKTQIKDLFEKSLAKQTEDVQARLDEDIAYMTRQAQWLGLIKDEAEVERIFMYQPDGSVESRIRREYSAFIKRKQLWRTVLLDNLMMCGIIAIPWPATVLGGLAMVAGSVVFGGSIMYEKECWRAEDWRKTLEKYVDENFVAIINSMREGIADCYGELVDWMAMRAQSLDVHLDDAAYVARRRELEEITEALM